MKKTMFVMAVAAVLVFAFATAALAATGIPNRSSAFLGSLPASGTAGVASTVQGERELAAWGSKAAYISWGLAKLTMNTAAGTTTVAGTVYAADATTTVHSGYSTTTVKCQVCHSAHKARFNGSFLTADVGGGCVACHGATSSFGSSKKVSADLDAPLQGGFQNEDQRHGKATACMDYRCHAASPHGVGVSAYAGAKSAMLSNWSDPVISAAIQSGASNTAKTAVLPGVEVGGHEWNRVEIDIFQPGLDSTSTAYAGIVNASPSADELAAGRAVVTGYTCANEGCHMNGSFNGLTEGSLYGNWRFYDDAGTTPDNGAIVANIADTRTQSITGHTLYSTFATATAQTAFAESGTCKSCHDATDVRLGGAKMFPHSNAVWKVYQAGTDAAAMADYGYVRLYSDSAWFNVADSLAGTKYRTNTRAFSKWSATYAPLTVGMDGACLKCHRDGVNSGVGITY